jgi:cell wall-associated NlpC family hydrolase
MDIGAIVFWGTSVGSAGHAAIYIGQGYVATTTGDGTTKEANARVSMNSFGKPLGWVAPSQV